MTLSSPTVVPGRLDCTPQPEPGRVPGEAGIWIFVFGELLMFTLLFSVFLYHRGQGLTLQQDSQHALSQPLGLLNTLLMLTSSWWVAQAVQSAQRGQPQAAARRLMAAGACGVGFVLVKYVEYGAKVHAGIGLTTNDFYMFYFILTGIHLMHVLIGLGAMACVTQLLRHAPQRPATLRHLESCATFWHLVDLLWIVLFALLYLLRAPALPAS